MTKFRNSLLISSGMLLLFALFLAGPVQAQATIQATDAESFHAQYSPADEFGRAVYLVEFAEPGLLRHQARAPGERFNPDSAEMLAARAELQARQQDHIQAIAGNIARSPDVTHHFLFTHSGIALRLTAEEAARVASLPGVSSVQREQMYELDTFRGPEFIGAGTIWDGTNVPGGLALQGELMVAAILDTGVDPSHPSFTNDAACGHGVDGVPDKLLSYLDCQSTDVDGFCNGPSPQDNNGHGSHTASTVAGNRLDNTASPSPNLPPQFAEISGVAPCAHIRSYHVCQPGGCPQADIQGGMNTILGLHTDVDVMNFSISGGTSPWNDNDRRKLDLVDAGVFVAASAGNTSTNIPDPVGNVGHRGPWVASIAASTHDARIGNPLSLVGGPQEVYSVQGSGPSLAADYTGDLRYAGAVDAANFEGCSAFSAGAFDGEAALISRGACSFADKVNNAVAAGAEFVVIFNHVPGAPFVMGALAGTAVSAVMVDNSIGLDLVATLAGGTAELLVQAATEGYVDPDFGDILAGFSLRGPTPSPLQNLQKPDITAPGVNIYAAVPGGYAFLSGTSMSGPHAAGAAVLVRQAQPDWTPTEVKSALMMTASNEGTKEDGVTPWDPDEVGSGRVDLTRAALAGLVMDETFQNFLDANPATGGDVRTLNIPAVRDLDCTPSCTWERTVRNTLNVPSNWTVTPDSFNPDLDLQVSPGTFSFTGDTSETVTLTITAAPQANLTAGIEFGQIVLTEDADQAPEANLTVAVSGTNLEPPEIDVSPSDISALLGTGSSTSVDLEIANLGGLDLNWSMEFFSTAANRGALDVIWNQPQDGTGGIISDEFLGSPAGDVVVLSANDFDINVAQEITEIFVPGFWNSGNVNTAVALNWAIYADANGVPAGGPTGGDAPLWSYSAAPGDPGVTIASNNITLDVEAATASGINLPTGRHWLVFYPTINYVDFGNRWNWSQGVQALGTSHLIDPANLFGAGATDWTPQTALGVGWPDTAFTLSGRNNCEATPPSWLSVDTTSGTVSGNDSQTVNVTLDAGALTAGTYEANLCIASDDPTNPLVFVPIDLQVADPADLPQIDVAPASVSVGVDVLNPTGGDSIDISNLGNDLDLEWSIEEALPLSLRGSGPSLSVNGMETHAALGNPANSSMTLEIGVGNQVTGIGYEVTIETFGGSWLSESRLAILSNAGDLLSSGAEIIPGAGDNAGGLQTYSSAGISALGSPVAANASGEIYLEWFESFVDDANPDSVWSDPASGTALPPGLTLECTNQAFCDAAMAGLPLPTACDLPSDVSWLSVSPASGTTAAMGISPVSVDVDASGLEPGTYDAILCIHSNDPATPLVEVPVSMEVAVPVNAALLEGTVQGLGYCQVNPIPAAGAGIEVVGSLDTFNLTADANGTYSLYLDDANGPVDVTASAPDHIGETETGVVIAGETTTVVDFGLVLDNAACATVAPQDMYFEMGADDSDSALLTLGNVDGTGSFSYAIQEAEINEVGYQYGLEGAGDLFAAEGFDRSSDRTAAERTKQQLPIVEAGIQGGPISADWAEGFEDIDLLAGAGWFLQNNSSPLGTTDWFQGNPSTFEAHQGAPEAYIGANFNNTTGGTGIISNWLLTPEITLYNGTELRFWTRVPTSSSFPDRLEVRLSTSGASTDVGSAATDVGSFDTLLVSVNEGLTVGGYPDVWTEFVIEVEGLAGPTSGRFGFRYHVTSAGPSGANSNFIGIDTVSVTQPEVAVACESPSNVPWLDAAPFFGTVAAGDSTDVTVSANSTGLESGLYEAVLCVNTDDPEASLMTVPVSMFVLAPESLAFDAQPANTEVGETLAPVTVVVLDGFGDVDVGDNSTVVELSLETNPTGATLSGQTSVTVVNGVAAFNDLSIDAAGTGYRFEAVDQGGMLVAALSDEFDILQAASTTTIIDFDPVTQMVGMPYTVTVGATGYNPTGMVTVSDDQGASCQIDVATEDSCDLTSMVAGTRTISADYAGDANNMASSDSDSYTVEQAASTTTITMIDPANEQFVNETYTVTVDVTGFNPTGMVMVDDGTGGSCQFDIEIDNSCELSSTTLGEKTITALYAGDGNNTASSDTASYMIMFTSDELFWDRFEEASAP